MRKKDKLRLDALNKIIENENVLAPNSLNETAVKEIIHKKDVSHKNFKIKTQKRSIMKTVIAAAACFAIVLTSVSTANAFVKTDVYKQQKISGFISYSQIRNTLQKADFFNYGYMFYDMADTKLTKESSQEIVSATDTNISATNIQVNGVSESDIVNTDGKYIYWLTDNKINIYSADKENSKLLSSIEKDKYVFSDFYLFENKLIGICYEDLYYDDHDCFYGNPMDLDKTTVAIYDISDAKKPKLLNEYTQSGGYNASRMVDNYLYLVSIKYVYEVDKDNDESYIPYATDENGKFGRIECENINSISKRSVDNYLVISAIDVHADKQSIETKALLGNVDDIYCSRDYMYIFSTNYDNYFDKKTKTFSSHDYTQIVKVDFDKLDIDFVNAANVDGSINDQYSVDEKDGKLRVALTSNDSNGIYNILVVLDENLKKIGETKKFAKDESIKSVRFLDNFAYVITFEQTDPLFVINLKNPKAPEIMGKAEISGFSSVLVPVEDNIILGIGYETQEEYDFVTTKDAVKLALFDVSDAKNPKVLDSKVYDDVESDAQLSVKGLLINNEDNYFAFAYNTPSYAAFEDYYDEEKDEYSQKLKDDFEFKHGVITFEIKNKKIHQINDFKTKDVLSQTRCVYIGNTIYTVTQNEGIQYFEMK